VKKLVWNTCKLEDETDWRIIDPYPPIVWGLMIAFDTNSWE
jgi:hypothetical protein